MALEEIEKLHRFREYGELVLQKLSLLPETLPDEIALKLQLQEHYKAIKVAAQNTVQKASSPIKIGVMGEFSSGKTLLLGSLIGYADALPISENPTTGNITSIRIVQQESYQTTKINSCTVTYLDHKGAKDCLDFMIKEVVTRAEAARLSQDQILVLPKVAPESKELWSNILSWCKEAWDNSRNPELRYLLKELVWFVRTYNSYGLALDGKSYDVDPKMAFDGLQLTSPSSAGLQNMNFSELPVEPVPLPKSPSSLMTEVLQRSFPLISQISVEIAVSKDIWDLSDLQASNKFVLLDFPGLGAANSGVRDAFLSLKELENVQTTLILLSGKQPGSDRANKIFTMMQSHKGEELKNRILVGVGRFDELPILSEESILDELIEDDNNSIFSEKLIEDEVLNKLTVLKTMLDPTKALTTDRDQIVLLSPYLWFADRVQRGDPIEFCSSKFLSELSLYRQKGSLENSKKLRDKWGKLGECILKSDKRSQIGLQLRYFADNNGIERLRELIKNSVIKHGLSQLLTDTKGVAEPVRSSQKTLASLLEEIQQQPVVIKENPKYKILVEAIRSLIDIYNGFSKSLFIQTLQDPQFRVPVTEVVYDELTFNIFKRTEWNSLFLQTGDDGIIHMPKSGGGIFNRTKSKIIPSKSDEFYPLFEDAVRTTEAFALDRVNQAIGHFLSKLSTQVSEMRGSIEAISLLQTVEQLLEQGISSPQEVESLKLFATFATEYVNPKLWHESIFKELQKTTLPELKPEVLFPLARQDRFHEKGQIFDWSPERVDNQKDKPKPANHQILVLRLRDEMISSAGLHLVQLVGELNQRFNTLLQESLTEVTNDLNELLVNEELLTKITSDNLEISTEPDWLRASIQICSVPYPD